MVTINPRNQNQKIFRSAADASAPPPIPDGLVVYAKLIMGTPVLYVRHPDGSETPVGSGSGGNGPSAALRRAAYDTPGSPQAPGNGATFGPTAGAPTVFALDQRNSLDFDTVLWASPGMVDLGVNPRRITITEDGIYHISAGAEMDEISTENVVLVMQNGFDTNGGHVNNIPAPNDGLEPTTGWIAAFFGFTAGAASALLQMEKQVIAHTGDFFFVAHQSSGTYHLLCQSEPGYIRWHPYLVVTKICDIPS